MVGTVLVEATYSHVVCNHNLAIVATSLVTSVFPILSKLVSHSHPHTESFASLQNGGETFKTLGFTARIDIWEQLHALFHVTFFFCTPE